MDKQKANLIWGAPKKFSTDLGERKISWLELFYDLVYVIAISRITHFLEHHPDVDGLADYIYFFTMIFWGWLNGSLYHDLHGTPGVRTRLITLWQMLLVAALVVTIKHDIETFRFNATVVLSLIQLFITYLWWSVGFYDKSHRALNRPYTTLYLTSFILILASLFVKPPYVRIIFYTTLILNYLPPILLHRKLKARDESLDLSPSMTERLGLFTMILFGEAITGIVSGTSELEVLNVKVWTKFSLGILIIFSLWWIFVGLVAGRENKKGTLNGAFTQMAFIPALMALGMAGAGFTSLFEERQELSTGDIWLRYVFGCSIAIFLIGISIVSNFLSYPNASAPVRTRLQLVLCSAAGVILIMTLLKLSVLVFLLLAFLLMVAIIIFMLNLGIKYKASTLMQE